MAFIEDRWHKAKADPGESGCPDHGRVPTPRHGVGLRWYVRWEDGGKERRRGFAKRSRAEWHLAHLAGIWCIVPRCDKSAVTEPPVLLCADHRDLLLQQCVGDRPKVHEPVVYFIRNGSRVKIGWTTNLKGRLSSLSLPVSAVALLVMGGRAEESALHKQFARTQVGKSEWFECSEEIEAYIAQHQPGPETYAGKLFALICGEWEQAAA